VVFNAVDTDVFTPTQTPDQVRGDEVLICGRMAKSQRDKGHDILFQSIPLAEEILRRRLRVRVVGSGPDRGRLESRAVDLGLAGRVEFVGRLSFPQLLEAYRHCGVFCMPTRVDRSNMVCWNGEGFGIVYVEAAACGRPVIASTEGGAPETIVPGETGLLADPRSADSVASAIAQVLGDPARADAMGRQGRLLAESRFSRRQFVERIRRLLEEPVSHQKGIS
jgi:phosphatidylinositol alpha-1,6-mannosyltransferase